MAFDPRLLDMTPDGQFRRPPGLPLSTRIAIGAVLLAVVAAGLAFAALAFWIVLTLIPVAIVAVAVAAVTIRFKIWRARRRASFGGERPIARWR